MTSGIEGEEPPKGTEGEGKEWKFPSLRRLGEFFARLLQLETTVGSLKEENRQIRKDLNSIQRQLDEQGGQLKVLAEFVRMATSAHVEATATKAAIDTIDRLLGTRRDTSRPSE